MVTEKITCDFCKKETEPFNAAAWIHVEPISGYLQVVGIGGRNHGARQYGDFCSVDCLVKANNCTCGSPYFGQEFEPCSSHSAPTETVYSKNELYQILEMQRRQEVSKAFSIDARYTSLAAHA